jgi:hypothetical protein
MKNTPCVMLLSASLGITAATAATAPSPTAVFDFGFDDTSLQGQEQGPRADEQTRLKALDTQLRQELAKSGCCQIVDLLPVAKQTENIDMWRCNGCDVDFAGKAGGTISVTGWVQKVSNLILNINVVARDVTTGRIIAAGSVDVRGNTDESWSRGLAYLLRDRLHPLEWR